MSKIQINDVKVDGAELFNDSETFFNELEDSELDHIVGGFNLSDFDFSEIDINKSIYDHPDFIIEPISNEYRELIFSPQPVFIIEDDTWSVFINDPAIIVGH